MKKILSQDNPADRIFYCISGIASKNIIESFHGLSGKDIITL